MKFRKRPVVVDAEQYDGADMDGVCHGGRHCPLFAFGHIHTLEGTMRLYVGDWVITGIQGERYPCRPDIFAATYESCAPQEPRADERGSEKADEWGHSVECLAAHDQGCICKKDAAPAEPICKKHGHRDDVDHPGQCAYCGIDLDEDGKPAEPKCINCGATRWPHECQDWWLHKPADKAEGGE